MRDLLVAATCVLLVSGCAGLSIKPIPVSTTENAHKNPSSVGDGYIVYYPIIVVEIQERAVCIERNQAGACTKPKLVCSAGSPFVLPDYGKPYLVTVKSGLGKAGIEVEVIDGWRLGKVSEKSDNTAILGTIEKILGLAEGTVMAPGVSPAGECNKPGLYRLSIKEEKVLLEELQLY